MDDTSDLLDLFSSDDGTARVQAAALARAMRQRRAAGTLASVVGGPFAAAGKQFSSDADQMQQQLGSAAQHRAQMAPGIRKAEEERTALAHPAAERVMRQTFAQFMPKVDVSDAPPRVLAQFLPLAEKAYGVDVSAQARRDVAEQNRLLRESLDRGRRGADDERATAIADAIENGTQPPDLKGAYRYAAPVRAELSRRGFDLSRATTDWQATQKHLATLNGPQQTRLRQAVGATYDQLDNVERLYEDWKHVGATSGVRLFNRAALGAAKQLPGDAGAAAQALEGQISLLTGELGNVLMGGNSPTDHGLKLAGTMLAGDWNEETFRKSIAQLRRDLQIRRNSMQHSTPAGASASNPYAAPPPAAAPGRALERKTVRGKTYEKRADGWHEVTSPEVAGG